jgi:methionyl-tRNA formyltransferase
MKVIFFGTPVFAANVLKFLVERGVDVVAVVSKPDKPMGRSKKLIPTPVKEVALACGIPLYQPDKISAPGVADVLLQYEADVFAVVAYGEIIKQHILDMPKKACINLHASILPKYRGAAPIQHAIIEGEKETGVTVIHMVKAMDAGDIIKCSKTPIDLNDIYGEVQERLCEIGSPLFLEVIQEIEQGIDTRTTQNADFISMAPKIELEDCEINWAGPAVHIHNLVRGVNPIPGAWCSVIVKGEKKRLKIYLTELMLGFSLSTKELHYQKKQGLIVGTGDGALLIKELQLEGKKRMSSDDLLRGLSLDDIVFE